MRLLREGDAHPAGGAICQEPHRVERLARPAGGDEDATASQRAVTASLLEQRCDAGRDLLRLGHAPRSHLALGELPFLRPDDFDAAGAQESQVVLRRGVLPHADVHRRRDQDGAGVRERRLGQEVVGEAVGQAGERVRRQRRDDEQVGPLQVRVRVVARRLPGEREERLRGHELLRGSGHDRIDVVSRSHEQAHERARLVGRDPPGDAEQDACHGS